MVYDPDKRKRGYGADIDSRVRRNTRRKNYWRVVRCLIPIVAVLGIIAGLLTRPMFQLKSVDVRGTSLVSADDVVSAAHAPLGKNIFVAFLRDRAAMAQRVKAANPAVQDVYVAPRLPATLLIAITERLPQEIVQVGQQAWFVDRTGVVYGKAEIASSELPIVDLTNAIPVPKLGDRLPTASDSALGTALMVLRAISRDSGRQIPSVTSVTVDQYGNLCLNTVKNFQVKLGQPDDIPQKLDAVDESIGANSALPDQYAYLDVTSYQHPAVMPRKAQVQEPSVGPDGAGSAGPDLAVRDSGSKNL